MGCKGTGKGGKGWLEQALCLTDGPPQGSIRAVAVAANIVKYHCAEGPPHRIHNGSSRAASGGGAAETRKNIGGERTPHRMHNGSSRAASGRRRKRGCWAVDFLNLPSVEYILGPICGIAFFRGSLKCVVEARSPQLEGLGSAVDSDVEA